MSASHEITALLKEWANGNRHALDEVTRRVYAELRRLAAGYLRRERPDHTLQPTALVHEVYLRLLDQTEIPAWQNRSHFFAIAARLMRQILVNHYRRRNAKKRRGRKLSLEEAISLPATRTADLIASADLIAIDNGLKALEEVDPRKCKALELRYFAGLSVEEIAEILDLSTKTIRRDLAFAEAWLYRQINPSRNK